MGMRLRLDGELLRALLALVLIFGAFALAGTMDYEEDMRHEQWMHELKENGEWVMW